MSKQVAFVVPIHPPHYHYGLELLESFYKYDFDKQSDMYFVFTNQKEKDIFSSTLEFKSIVLDKKLEDNILSCKYEGVINKKKFYALYQLKDKYDYSIVIDAESEFLQNVNLYAVCENYFSNKILLANRYKKTSITNQVIQQIFDEVGSSFTEQELAKVDKNLYMWFNQPCIYENATLNDFFEKTSVYKNIKKLKSVGFDYYYYFYYLIIVKNFEQKEIKNAPVCDYGFIENNFVKNKDLKNISESFLVVGPFTKSLQSKNTFLLLQKNVKRNYYYTLVKIKHKILHLIASFIPFKKLRHKVREL